MHKYIILLLVLIGVLIGIVAIYSMNWLLLIAYTFLYLAALLGNSRKRPYAISRKYKNSDEWHDTLVYSYSLWFIRACCYIEHKIIDDYTQYAYSPFELLSFQAKQKAINEYFTTNIY